MIKLTAAEAALAKRMLKMTALEGEMARRSFLRECGNGLTGWSRVIAELHRLSAEVPRKGRKSS